MSKRSLIDYDSTSSDDSEQIDARQQPNRKKAKPSYFGTVVNGSEGSFSSVERPADPFSDDSLDLYLPSPKKSNKRIGPGKGTNFNKIQTNRRVYQIKKNAPKSTVAQIRTNRDDRTKKNQRSIDLSSGYSFDSQFDMLDFGNTLAAAFTSSVSSDAAKIDSPSGSSNELHRDEMNENYPSYVEHTDSAQSEVLHDTDALDIFQNLNTKLNEIISRMATMENAMLAFTTNSGTKDDKSVQLKRVRDELCADAELFMKSNALPTKNVDELGRFEANLMDSVFYTAAVSTARDFLMECFVSGQMYICLKSNI